MNPRRMVGAILDCLDKKDRVRHLRNSLAENWRERWLYGVKNLVHVGANMGQERELYARRGLGVLWIEPIKSVFDVLLENIRPYPRQRAVNALLSDAPGKEYRLHLAANGGASSSILEPAEGHLITFPDIKFQGSITMLSETLDNLLDSDVRQYDALVLDTQGAELLILRGSTRHLKGFRYIQAEAADFELYSGYPMASEIIAYSAEYGFSMIRKTVFARHPKGGEVFDLLFRRDPP